MSNKFAALERELRDEMEEQGIPSMALTVAQQGEIVWETAIGMADHERQIPATPELAYPIASVTKPMTATAIMQLVEQGKLALDQPMNDALPAECPMKVWVGDPDSLTVERLLTHTAGQPTFSSSYRDDDRVAAPSMEACIRRYGHAYWEPGERYCYANFGYGILDFLVGHVSGMSYRDYLAKHVFAPLGMTSSSVNLPNPQAVPRYMDDMTQAPGGVNIHEGASCAFASARDLFRFGRYMSKQPLSDQERILSDESIDAMLEPRAGREAVGEPQTFYGLGWVIEPHCRPLRISHAGGMSGGAAKLLMIPEAEIVIAVVSNMFKPLTYTLEERILSLLPGEFHRPETSPAPEQGSLDLKELGGRWSGEIHTYTGTFSMWLEVHDCGHVTAKIGELQPVSLVDKITWRDGWFSGSMAGMIDTPDANRVYRYPIHHLELDLKLRGERLNGCLTSVAGCQLGHWVDLQREG